ncbi:hypothetical protein [Halocella sp. SP3-1]|uniref:hypothetical protein n=1 Tax=Halocella sp. SP3-1 TaxID=2382161 RepID=UPI0013E048AD|nr:hypothetical protein [Halocella sp. SP3-1]
MHNISKCKECKQRRGNECMAFNDMKAPILNEEGECNGAIYTDSEYQKLKMSLGKE